MGAVLGLCSAAQLACCCGSAACSLCCSACPSCRNSTSSRIMYALMLLLGTIVACIMLSPGLQDSLRKVPFCTNTTSSHSLVPGSFTFDCQSAVGYLAVYRVCFVLTCFFCLMALITIGVKSSKDLRSGIHNGFWGIKYLLVIGGIIGAFFIPEGSFGTTWMYFGMIGGFMFILIQLILIVDFAHTWAEVWVGNYEETESRGWYAALLAATFINFALAITGIVLLFIFFTKADDCSLNKFFISFNLILAFIVSVVSILPVIQEHQPRSGLLQSSVVTLYVVYLTWSSVSNSPDKDCNPGFLAIVSGTDNKAQSQIAFDKESIIGLIIWMCCVLYSSLRSASKSSKITMSEHVLAKDTGTMPSTGTTSLVDNAGMDKKERKNLDSKKSVDKNSPDKKSDKKRKCCKRKKKNASSADGGESGGRTQVWDNEEEGVAYNWSFFHIMFLLATLYVMMTLTNWYEPNSTLKSLNANSASMWVKAISSWLCIALYGWTLIAPIILPNREFTYS